MGNHIKGPLIIKPVIFDDQRGYFYESWNERNFNNIIGQEINFKQDNQSYSNKGVLRGLHFQIGPNAQAKLIRVTSGSIFDVIVDIRKTSPTFKRWFGVNLNAENKKQLWIPIGFAHGFFTLSEYALVQYKTTAFWDGSLERSLNWQDKDIGITWPFSEVNIKHPITSKKDDLAPTIKEILKSGDLFL